MESLTQKISRNRREFLSEYGVEIPRINIIDSIKLGEWEYEIRVSGVPVQSFCCKEGCSLAFDFGDVTSKMQGEPATDPVYGKEALWIPDTEIDTAKNYGYRVYPHDIIVITGLAEVIRKNMKSIVTSQYVEELLAEVEEENCALVKTLQSWFRDRTLFTVKGVLASLLEECVSIRDIVPILEVIADATEEDLIKWITERARQLLGSAIVSQVCNGGELNVIEISEETASYIQNHCFDEKYSHDFMDSFISESNIVTRECKPVILVPDEIRKAVWKLLNPHIPDITVLSLSEVQVAMKKSSSLKVNTVSKISVESSSMKNDNISDDEKIMEQVERSDVLITNEASDIVVGLRYEKKSMDCPEVVLARKDLKHVKELIAGKNDCVVTSIHEPTLAKALFVDCKEGEPIGYSFIESVAAVYSKLKDKKIVI